MTKGDKFELCVCALLELGALVILDGTQMHFPIIPI